VLVKQLLGESLVFAAIGGVFGMMLVVVGVKAFGP